MAFLQICTALLFVSCAVHAQPRVTLKQGTTVGKTVNYPTGDVVEFLGLPYAEKPTDKLRFKLPKLPKAWGNSEYDATQYKPMCMQNKKHLYKFDGVTKAEVDAMPMSEDCLYLNVFAPGTTVNADAKLPVMVWFHSGQFKYGSGQLVGSSTKETPEALVGMKNVIVVTFNYRLNVFGFLTLGTDKVPGNTAIADQTKALMWVKKNIAMFGGDPYKITLFGDGYGARSIQMQLFNDYAYGLFDKAAISSGADASWAVPTREYAAKKWWMYADVLGCVDQMHNTTLTGACLQSKTGEELLAMLPSMYPTLVIDGHMLKDQPVHLLMKGKFNPVKLLIGCNSEDGDSYMVGNPKADMIYRNGIPMEYIMDKIAMLSNLGYPMMNTEEGREMGKLVMYAYFKNHTSPQANLRSFLDLKRDAFYAGPAMKLAWSMKETGMPVYMYYFDHSSPVNVKRHQNATLTLGAGSGTEAWYILGDTDMKSADSAHEKMALSMMNAWTSFATTGKPMFLDENDAEVEWPKFDKMMSRVVLKHPLSATTSIKQGMSKAALFFNKLFPSVLMLKKAEHEMMEMKKMVMKKMMMDDKMGKPEPEFGDKMPGWDGDKPAKPEHKPEHKPGQKPEPEGEKSDKWDDHEGHDHEGHAEPEKQMHVVSIVMLALVSLLVLLMIIVFGVMCSLYGHLKRNGTPPPSKF